MLFGKCCCCLPLKIGAIFIILICTAPVLASLTTEPPEILFYERIAVFMALMLSALLALSGIFLSKPLLILPMQASIIAYLVTYGFMIVNSAEHDPHEWPVAICTIICICTVLFYCMLVLHSVFIAIKRELLSTDEE